ncbi:hypothetical protein H4R18_004253 [Coemansia javaensis]|uniref:Bromo domain-containing protein n=1 Tax=Coemansia javaensis TaxID=2761396 RepID=A0A9W8H4S6_9FUNG|nr:hypothetical protein H4R18_004253 [Coemansia javaensis]
MSSLSDPGGCAVRDRLTILGLAAELGVEDWTRVAALLAQGGRTLLARPSGYTQEECREIYDAAVNGHSKGAPPQPAATALHMALSGLKGQRLDEIGEALARISEDLAALKDGPGGQPNREDALAREDEAEEAVSEASASAEEAEGTDEAEEADSAGEAEEAGNVDEVDNTDEADEADNTTDINRTGNSGGSASLSGQADVAASGGGGRPGALAADKQQLRNWKKNASMVWREISGHRLGGMFQGPIKSADAPRYYEAIRRPLDLKAIKNRVRDEEITTTVEFYRDIMHMFMNALMYNSEDTEVHHMTMEILSDAQAYIEQLLQAEAAADAAPGGAGPAARGEDEGRYEDHDGDDSDASAPAKRRRRVASERASKHLRV